MVISQHTCNHPICHHTPSNGRARSMPVMFHPRWSILGVMYDQYICDPLLWLLVPWYINLIHGKVDWLTWVSTSLWMVGAHGSSHTIQGRQSYCFFAYAMVYPLAWLLMQWCISIIHAPTDGLEGVSTPSCLWMIRVHWISYIIHWKRKKNKC